MTEEAKRWLEENNRLLCNGLKVAKEQSVSSWETCTVQENTLTIGTFQAAKLVPQTMDEMTTQN
jgi:hypothetical protein